MATADVRPATRADIPALSVTLGKAFFDDPVMMWLLPDDDVRRRKLHKLFASITRYHHLSRGGVEVATGGQDIGAAALWDPPGEWKQTRAEELRAMPGLLLTFGSALGRGLAVTEMMKKAHPEEPHWYLAVIGSDPAVRGKGFGNALMRSRLDRCDAEYAPAYLESSKPENVPYYERFGFEVTGEFTLPDGGPPLIPMWRTPR
ncbi:GNAT family N-acetyltransferase [Mycolicibacterium arenosum]|uniref:GNAT family N-acetyltransferase n=1 Tax=Mycolicibacterium arenosum TaxID=2952157 RepID=A0ABT1M2Z8_9MYCO|nr:GNAT family N-acetyltransferase [Mycolicibacterium sp. CAU 1645]MCP9273528.1 GNAT family N-acetyltransferase [Mycolicibacterium sp. CAU 1645]